MKRTNASSTSWERIRHDDTGQIEPDRAFQAFVLYRDMKDRSLAKVTSELRAGAGRDDPADEKGSAVPRRREGVSSTVEGWSRNWNWVARARAWDDEQDRLKRNARVAEMESMRKRQIAQAEGASRVCQVVFNNILKKAQGPTFFDRVSPKAAIELGLAAARMLRHTQHTEHLARVSFDDAAQATEAPPMPISGYDFTWVETTCRCGHPHSAHDQEHENRALIPCTTAGCDCQRFDECELET